MGLGLEGASGADAFQQRLRQQVLDQLAQEQQKFQNSMTVRGADRADRALSQQDELTRLKIQELSQQKAATEADQQFKLGDALHESLAPDSVVPMNSPAAPLLQRVGGVRTEQPTLPSTTLTGMLRAGPTSIAGDVDPSTGASTSGANMPVLGSIRGQVNAGNPLQLRTLPTARQQNVLADNARADAALKNTAEHQREVFGLQSQNASDRLDYQSQLLALQRDKMSAAAEAKANKPLVLSAGGKASKGAIEQAGPLTDQVLAMMEKEFPGIEKQDGTYNTTVDKLGSLVAKGKYLLGFNDPNDPRRQIVNLLQPIQAGQYTRSSRSYKMVELALKHMADMSQTPEAQYARAKELRAIMPEMMEGLIRAERPVDPDNPLAGSYFDPNRQTATDAAAGAPPAAPNKVQKWVRRGGKLVPE